MRVTIILGNVASGKTTLAKQLSARTGAPVFHADAYAWAGFNQRRDAETMFADFLHWAIGLDSCIVEGCYGEFARLVDAACKSGSIILINTPISECLRRFDARGVEPDKFPDAEYGRRVLAYVRENMLSYDTREDDMGRRYHERLIENLGGQVVP